MIFGKFPIFYWVNKVSNPILGQIFFTPVLVSELDLSESSELYHSKS